MKSETIIKRLIVQAESYGIENAEKAIRRITDVTIPRCGICGRPVVVIGMTGTDCFWIGCPNKAHHKEDVSTST